MSISKKKFDMLEQTIVLDEIEAKIYGFLEKNIERAYTFLEIYLNLCVDELWHEEFREDDLSLLEHPKYLALLDKIKIMEKEGKTAGRYHKGKYYYAL